MGVLNRLFDMTRAAANELMDKIEDPAMMLNQYVRNMQGEIDRVQAELYKQEASVRGLGQQAEEAARLAEFYDAKALEAMSGGYEAAAREALAAKLHYAEKARESGAWQEAAKNRIAELTQQLENARDELAAMQKKRDELVARLQKTAERARTSMPSFTGCGFEGGSAARGFQRVEEKINQWEAHAELRSMPYSYGAAGAGSGAANGSSDKDALINEQLEQLRKRTQA